MKHVILIFAFAAAACSAGSALRQPSDATLIAAFDAGRARVEFHGGTLDVVVLDAALESRTRVALERARKAISLDRVPSSSAFSLPARYFLLKSLRVDNGEGQMSGTVGPVSKPVSMGACGSTFKLALDGRSGSWQAKVVALTVC
jgi:hypothetical protein